MTVLRKDAHRQTLRRFTMVIGYPKGTPMTTNTVEENVRKQVADAQDMVGKSVRAWSDLMVTSTDMAYDVVLKNWNYSRSLRGSAEQAVEDAINTQSRLVKEMMQVWQDYSTNFQDIVAKTTK
jgi:hypothetical protein